MRFHKQKYSDHNPENGVWGDCYRTAIACLLDYELEEVPNFVDPRVHKNFKSGTFSGAVEEWLEARGLYRVVVTFPQGDGDRKHSPQEILQRFALTRTGRIGCWLLAGKSRYGTNHVVICRGNRIIHDPSDTGIIGPAVDRGGNEAYLAHIITPFAIRAFHPQINPRRRTMK